LIAQVIAGLKGQELGTDIRKVQKGEGTKTIAIGEGRETLHGPNEGKTKFVKHTKMSFTGRRAQKQNRLRLNRIERQSHPLSLHESYTLCHNSNGGLGEKMMDREKKKSLVDCPSQS
jgi:hypothetical protein